MAIDEEKQTDSARPARVDGDSSNTSGERVAVSGDSESEPSGEAAQGTVHGATDTGGDSAKAESEPPAKAPRPEAGQGRGAPADVTAENSAGAPAWVLPAYVAGLVALYLGQRVLVTSEIAIQGFTVLGLALVAGATVYRFGAGASAQTERGRIEKLMALLSAGGVVGIALYFASTQWGLEKLGLADADATLRDRAETFLTIAWISVIAASVTPLLFAEAALFPMRSAALLEARRVHAASASGFVLALAAVYGSLFVYTASESKMQADYSYFRTTEPGESTRKIVASLDEPLRVTAFFPDVSEVKAEVENYLTALAQDGNVEIRVADRYLEPQLAKELKVTQDGTVVFQYKDGKRSLNVGTDLSKARTKLKALDKAVNTRLLKLMRTRYVAYLTVGHGEINDIEKKDAKETGRSTKIIKQMLDQLNFQTKDLGLSEGLGREVPDDATVVMVLGPTEPFAPEELEALSRYADAGGHFFIALDSDSFSTRLVEEMGAAKHPTAPSPAARASGEAAPEATGGAAGVGEPETGASDAEAGPTHTLQALANLVGLTYEPTVLANERFHVQRRANDSDRTLIVSNRFSSHASVSTVGKRRRGVLLAGSGSLEKSGTTTNKVDFALRSPPKTFADADGDYQLSEQEEKPSFNLAAAVSRAIEDSAGDGSPKPDDAKRTESEQDAKQPAAGGAGAKDDAPGKGLEQEPKEMRAFVLADADAATDLVLANFSENQFFIYDAIRWLGGEESFIGELNSEEDVRIEHTKQKDQAWFYSTVFGVPFFILGAGVAFSRRSRRRQGGNR